MGRTVDGERRCERGEKRLGARMGQTVFGVGGLIWKGERQLQELYSDGKQTHKRSHGSGEPPHFN